MRIIDATGMTFSGPAVEQDIIPGYDTRDGILRPDIEHSDVLSIPQRVDFVYVMRKETAHTMAPMAERIASETGYSEDDVRTILNGEYETFFAGLADTIVESLEHKRTEKVGAIQLHVFTAEDIERKTLQMTEGRGGHSSADPLKGGKGVGEIYISRHYLQGGTKSTGITNRPGSAPLSKQLAAQRERFGDTPVIFNDDDTYAGGTARDMIEAARAHDLNVVGTVFDIQMGKSQKLVDAGITAEAAYRYDSVDDRDMGDISDLGDPRDFLFGGSGLVVAMSDDTYGRVPYILPFVSPEARMGLPKEAKAGFSHAVLKLNYDFYSRVGAQLGREITLRHLDPHFAWDMHNMYGMPADMPVTQAIDSVGSNITRLRTDIEAIGTYQAEQYAAQQQGQAIITETMSFMESRIGAGEDDIRRGLEKLGLMDARLVTFDVNGTMFPDSMSSRATFDPTELAKFRSEISRLRRAGTQFRFADRRSPGTFRRTWPRR